MDLKNKTVTRLKAGGWKKRGPNKLLYAGEVDSRPLPLDYMLSVMRDPIASAELRFAMALRAAPYCHPRYKSVQPPPRKTEIPEKIEMVIIDPRDEHTGSNPPPVSTPRDEHG